ncbi:hypothetical protein Hypma_001521 [Hypsizygus marmoreus]|uniref:Peptidase M28 domain-containing protein n=1 Tax=Hypsizygus marmoreus TaxID=39966 RepID=A0A369K140_HYPMA|nr:hypothetical protein Hypma_001521 [Hypsizygus marmoreus]
MFHAFSVLPISILLLVLTLTPLGCAAGRLSQVQEQRLFDRLYQTNLRGPRWTGNDNQNTLTDLVASSMRLAGLEVETLNYTLNRWDPRWWSLTLTLMNGTSIGMPMTGYWPHSGNSGLGGVTAPLHDAGTFGLKADGTGDPSTLDLEGIPPAGAVVFFDNPSPTRNYSEPGYRLLGTSRGIDTSEIPELGNLTNPHWQSAKTLNFTALHALGVRAIISSWTHTSPANAALQFLPNDAPPGKNGVWEVPGVYVSEETGRIVRGLVGRREVESATVVLDAPSVPGARSATVVGRLRGTKGEGEGSVLLYTHSDGPSIIEENGPILLLTIAEYFAVHRPAINLDFVITTGHMSGGRLSETRWMDERPALLKEARAAVVCEHFGAREWKDQVLGEDGELVYGPTGRMEPMWTMGNDSAASALLHQLYLEAFEGTPEDVRMALLAPQTVGGVRSKWYGAGGSSVLGRSNLPTIGIIPQPDYLWTAQVDGGWSKLDLKMVVVQINTVLRLIESLDRSFLKGEL